MNSADKTELVKTIMDIFNEKIPFNKNLGLTVDLIDDEKVRLKINMRDELIGNYMRGTLHGGVISSMIDVTGGLSAFMGTQKKLPTHSSLEEKLDKFIKLGTIDLRIDYLRPGYGAYFTATGYNLRTGNKVAVTRIEVNDDKGELIAVGTGSYVVS